MRKIIPALVILLLILPALPIAHGQGGDPAVLAGDWLKSQQAENGSFGDEIGATSLSLIALAALGESNQAAVDWLESNLPDEIALDEASLSLIALKAQGVDTSVFADGELLAAYSELLRQSRGEAIDELCLALIARHNLDTALPETAIAGLVALQNEDGGFGSTPDADSDVVTTSVCAQVLYVAEQSESLTSALDYLQAMQLEDGGWTIDSATPTSDPIATGFVLHALTATEQTLTDWGSPERTLFGFLNFETGGFEFPDAEDEFLNLISTAVAIPIFRGQSLISFATGDAVVETGDEASTDSGEEGPALDANWALVGSGFGMTELDTADDFFVTVVDPFTDDELYGIQIINWTAEYQYTGYIVQNFLPAEVLLWMAEQDPTVWENISSTTLQALPPDVLAQLPEEVQARATQ